MNNKLFTSIFFITLFYYSNCLFAQWIETDENSIINSTSAWETEYRSRVNVLLDAKDVWNWDDVSGDTDAGKRYWSTFLAKLYKAGSDTSRLYPTIRTYGKKGIDGYYTGRFYKPFSAPGATYYFMRFKEDIAKADPGLYQINKMKTLWNYPNRSYTSRVDGKMDPIYNCNEYNSENYDRMARVAGYILSHHFDDNTNIPDGNLPAQVYYKNWVDNWVRATYNAGRVEWLSHVYSGFCIQAASVVYEFAETVEDKLKGRAVMDWMALEQALHFLDGHHVAAASRNKNEGMDRYAGSIAPYNFIWFNDNNHPASLSNTEMQTLYASTSGNWTCGFVGLFKYRPPQAIIDIAQRNYNFPVEIRSAKPFYRLDYDNFEDWKGETTNGRKFEYEWLYLQKNYTLSSSASGRPSATGPFWELCTWRLGVKGLSYQVYGNTGSSTIAGRSPYEEIGQYRNSMMRLIKGSSTAWLALPKAVSSYEMKGNTLFADLGNGVYLAVQPFNAKSYTKTANTLYDNAYTKISWTFNNTNLSALVLELGTIEEHGSYDAFKDVISNSSVLTSPSSVQLEYRSTLGNVLKMEWVNTTTYSYVDNYCSTIKISVAGNYPHIWYDGVGNDFSAWKQWEVVYGDKIVHSNWGDGDLEVNSLENSLKISVSDIDANVKYFTSSNPILFTNVIDTGDCTISVFPNPVKTLLTIDNANNLPYSVFSIRGVLLERGIVKNSIDMSLYENGFYLLNIGESFFKVIKN